MSKVFHEKFYMEVTKWRKESVACLPFLMILPQFLLFHLAVFLCSASFLSLYFTFPLHLSSLSCSKLHSLCIAYHFSSLTSQSLSTTGELTVGFFSLIHYILPCSSVPCQIKQEIFHRGGEAGYQFGKSRS